jgi:hypothetical protein
VRRQPVLNRYIIRLNRSVSYNQRSHRNFVTQARTDQFLLSHTADSEGIRGSQGGTDRYFLSNRFGIQATPGRTGFIVCISRYLRVCNSRNIVGEDRGVIRGKCGYKKPVESFGYAIRGVLYWHVRGYGLDPVRFFDIALRRLFHPAKRWVKGSSTSMSRAGKCLLVATATPRLRLAADQMLPDIFPVS